MDDKQEAFGIVTDKTPRLAIVLNGGRWFIRRIALVHRDDANGEMVYHCDEDLGGPYEALSDAIGPLELYLTSLAN